MRRGGKRRNGGWMWLMIAKSKKEVSPCSFTRNKRASTATRLNMVVPLSRIGAEAPYYVIHTNSTQAGFEEAYKLQYQ